MVLQRILRNTIKAFQIIDLLILSLQNLNGYASITLTVSPSGPVEVNQTVTIQCSYQSNPGSALFYSRANLASFCDLAADQSGVGCLSSLCSSTYTATCPNDKIYSVEYPIPQSWHGKGVYCKGLFTGDQESNQINFTIIVLVTSVTLTPTQNTVDAGKQIILTCQADYCYPEANITWYKASTSLTTPTTDTTDTNSNGLVRTTSVLQYTGVVGDNGQQVYCRASNKKGQSVESSRYTLNIKYPPSSNPVITSSPPGLQYEIGTHVNLTCQLSGGNPVATLLWRCKGISMTGTNQSNPSKAVSVLQLDMDSSYNNQQCTCAASHPLLVTPKSNSVSLSISVQVTSVTLAPTQVTVDEGKTIALTCKTDYCNPAATITWYKASTSLTTPTTDTTDTDSNDLMRTTSVLQYTGVAGDNGQHVYCRAVNKKGHSVESSRYTLNIRFISEVLILPPRGLNVVVGQRQILIHCYVENANPEENIEYRWIKSDGINSSMVSSSQTYIIKRVDDEDSGRYICTARNSAGNSSAFIDVIVQSTPLAPKVEYVFCKSTFVNIIWSSSHKAYHDDELQETLQYSEIDKAFVNVTYEQLNSTEISIHHQKVTTLKPKTEYTFRVLTSNRYGVTFSNNLSCVTDPERQIEMYQDCDEGQIIGGTLGGFALFLILAMSVVVILYKRRKGKSISGKSVKKDQNASYVDQFSQHEVHQYEGISTDTNKETLKTNVYEKIEASSPTDMRAEYMELTDSTYINKEKDKSVEVASDLYSNTK